jgi:acyl-CoA thioesterase
MRYEVKFHRDGHAAATVEVDASSDEEAVRAALASGQVSDGVLDGPWTATVDPVRPE